MPLTTQFAPQITVTTGSGPHQNWELESQSRFLPKVEGAQLLELTLCLLVLVAAEGWSSKSESENKPSFSDVLRECPNFCTENPFSEFRYVLSLLIICFT